jgi:DNA-directed RNA polymerase subunit RPC12/RpoP
MSYIDLKYINIISPRLQKFAKKKDYLYNFRCPYCGDSAKNKNRARGFFFLMKSDMVYKCHNCGIGRNLANFLKDIDMNVHDQYVMERFKQGTTGRSSNVKEPKFTFDKPVFEKPDIDLKKISDLNITHPARSYLQSRNIPEKYFSQIYFAEDFATWAKLETKVKEPRIVLPLRTVDGKLFGYQGRSLDKNTKLRYITVLLDNEHPKLYGLDRIDTKNTIYITEGPFDSLFLSNSMAMCGADVSLDTNQFPDRVFVFDNEPRNKQIVDRYEKTIASGEQVVIWPKEVQEKDINDMVLAGRDVRTMVESNVYSGLEAKVKLIDWKKV